MMVNSKASWTVALIIMIIGWVKGGSAVEVYGAVASVFAFLPVVFPSTNIFGDKDEKAL